MSVERRAIVVESATVGASQLRGFLHKGWYISDQVFCEDGAIVVLARSTPWWRRWFNRTALATPTPAKGFAVRVP